jgi:O-antigen ligase
MLMTILIVVFDSFVQLVFKYNIFGYKLISSKNYVDNMFYITSFFDDEKKLGSYLVRFIALLIAGSYLFLSKKKVLFLIPVIILIVFMTSERTALFHIIWISSIYFLFCSKKSKLIFTGIFITALFLQVVLIDNVRLIHKQFSYTLEQIGIKENTLYEKKYIRYFSDEHENLAYTSIIIAKNQFLLGSGVKTFYQKCNELKKKLIISTNKRGNKLVCSTHPHNLYLQILTEIGIFGFIFALFFLVRIIINLINYFFKKNNNNYSISFFFLNVSILVNIFPLIPSGNFFNNWLSLIFYFQIGIYLYFKKYYIK